MTIDPALVAQLDGFDEVGRLVRALVRGEQRSEPGRSTVAASSMREAPVMNDSAATSTRRNTLLRQKAMAAPLAAKSTSELVSDATISLGDFAADFVP